MQQPSCFTSLLSYFTLGIIVLTIPHLLMAQHGNILKGKVTDSVGNPIIAVNVHLPQHNRGTTTDQNGHFLLTHLPAGTHTVRFSRIGYHKVKRQLNFNERDTIVLHIHLRKSAMNIETITITESSHSTDLLKTKDIQVLSDQKKEENQSTSLGAAVGNLAGIDNISTGSQMGKPVIRGLSGNRVKVLYDDIPMDYQQFGVRHMPTADPFLAEEIKIIQGPSSVLYGSDALGGAINIIPARVPGGLHQPSFLHGQVLTGFHSNNREWMGGIKVEGGSGPWGGNAALIKRTSGNMRVPDIPTAQESGDSTAPRFTGELDHTDFDQINGMIGGGYTGDFGKISFHYGHWNNEQNILLPNGTGVGQHITNDILALKGHFELKDHNILRTKVSYLRNQ